MTDSFMPEGFFPVIGYAVASDNGGWSTDIINLADAEMCYVVVHKQIAAGAATDHTLYMGADVTTCATALPQAVPIWYGNPTTATQLLTRGTDAVTYNQAVGITNNFLLIFKVDPAILGTGYHTIKLTISASGQANLTSVIFWIKPRYSGKPANRAITEFLA